MTSQAYQALQKRFLPLPVLQAEELEEEFLLLRDRLGGGYSSDVLQCDHARGDYFGTMVGGSPVLKQHAEDAFVQKEEDTRRPTVASTKEHQELLQKKLSIRRQQRW